MEQREKDALDAHITGNYGEDSVSMEEVTNGVNSDEVNVVGNSVFLHRTPSITLGVTIERHTKGTNWSVKVDGAESLDQLLAIADKMRNEMEHRFGSIAEVR